MKRVLFIDCLKMGIEILPKKQLYCKVTQVTQSKELINEGKFEQNKCKWQIFKLKTFLIFMIHNWCLYLHINEIYNTFIGIFFLFFAVLRKQLRTKWFIYV